MAGPDIGQPPTPQQQQYLDAAADLTPDKSLGRIDDLAKFVFANVAIVGTVIAGLGLFSSASLTLRRGPSVVGIPLAVALVAASLLASLGALFPALAKVNPGDLQTVERFFDRQIPRRGLFAMASLALFGAAVVAAGAVAVTDAGIVQTAPAISVQTDGIGKNAQLEVHVNVTGLPTGSTIMIAAVGHLRRRSQALCSNVSLVSSSGAATISCDTLAGHFRSYTVTGLVIHGNHTLQRNSVSLTR